MTERVVRAVPLLLALVAEAGWIGVVAALVQEYARVEAGLDVPVLATLAAAGTLAARLLARRLGDAWPLLAPLLVLGGGVVGVLAAPAARVALASAGSDGGLVGALGANPAGLLGGLAVLRGLGYLAARPPEDRLEQLLSGGTLAIVACAVAGGFVPDPWRSRFVVQTLSAGVAFAAAGVMALALRRQSREGGDRGADWQRNPRWVALLVAVVVLLATAAALSADLVRPTLELLVGLALLPLLIFGLLFGWTRRGVKLGAVLGLLAVAVAIVLRLLGESDRRIEIRLPEPIGPEQQAPATLEPSVVAVGGGLLLVLLAIVVVLLVRWWTRRVDGGPADASEERFVDYRPLARPRRPRRGWLGLRAAPRDAVEAYLALLAQLEQREGLRREPFETPREHAARLRRDHGAGLSLELLAADYALTAFGSTRLTEREERRAVQRGRRLARSLRPADVAPELELG